MSRGEEAHKAREKEREKEREREKKPHNKKRNKIVSRDFFTSTSVI